MKWFQMRLPGSSKRSPSHSRNRETYILPRDLAMTSSRPPLSQEAGDSQLHVSHGLIAQECTHVFFTSIPVSTHTVRTFRYATSAADNGLVNHSPRAARFVCPSITPGVRRTDTAVLQRC